MIHVRLLFFQRASMAEGSITRQRSLKDLIKSLHKELSTIGSGDDEKASVVIHEDKCMTLLQAIAKTLQPTASRTTAMDKLLVLAKRKASCFSDRATSRQFRLSIAAIEKSLLLCPASTTAPVKTVSLKKQPPNKTNKLKKSAQLDTSRVAAPELSSLPSTVEEYANRLKKQSKDLYKNPPALPPPSVKFTDVDRVSKVPQRDKSGRFAFEAFSQIDNATTLKIVKQFRPNRSPEEILRGGAFGGTYFRSITSAVTNQTYDGSQVVRETLPDSWRISLNEATYLTSSKYRVEINKYGVKCGGSLGMWESSGWIADSDPYGWFQWYCHFFQGRRSSDDVRQIQRWMGVAGPKGRFKSQLCNKILAANTHMTDTSISPVIRQTLWHWGLELTEELLKEHKDSR
jgi:hypothetical protein